MPHLFVSRVRLHKLTKSRADLRAQFRWETVNAVIYKIGGLIFIIGSIFFFPALDRYSNIGAWSFLVGSVLYLVVTAHDLVEVRHNWRSEISHSPVLILERIAAVSYFYGTILFTIHTILYDFLAWQYLSSSVLQGISI